MKRYHLVKNKYLMNNSGHKLNDSENSLGADEEPAVILRMNFSIREVQVLCQSYGVSVDFRNIKATTSIV